MKGLLHRLADRATGSAIAVRSNARLPFANSRAQFATEPESLAIGDAAPATSAPDASTAAREVSPVPMIVPPPSPISARQTVSVEVAGEVRAVRTDPASSMFDARVPPRLVESRPADEVHVSSQHIEPAIRAQDRAPPHEPARARHSERGAPSAREPALLMPEAVANSRPRPAPLVPATTLPTAAGMHAAAHDGPNEVQIHIGRIEITAVHQAAPLRHRPAPANPPMSLDAYLAKRGRT